VLFKSFSVFIGIAKPTNNSLI